MADLQYRKDPSGILKALLCDLLADIDIAKEALMKCGAVESMPADVGVSCLTIPENAEDEPPSTIGWGDVDWSAEAPFLDEMAGLEFLLCCGFPGAESPIGGQYTTYKLVVVDVPEEARALTQRKLYHAARAQMARASETGLVVVRKFPDACDSPDITSSCTVSMRYLVMTDRRAKIVMAGDGS